MSLYDEMMGANNDTSQQSSKKVISGITTGVVKENWDDKHPGMVRVELFMASPKENLTHWMRVAHPYAGKEYGFYLLPEVGDEVMVAFNMGDPDEPYVIGCLWNNIDKIPPETAVEKNTIKRIKTKGGHEIIFDDEEGKESIVIHTPKGLTLSLADEKSLLTLGDKEGKNVLKLDCEGGAVTLQGEKKLTLSAGSVSITLDGDGKSASISADKINIEAGQNLIAKGSQGAQFEGGTKMQLKSGGTFKAEASGTMELKGVMVKIN